MPGTRRQRVDRSPIDRRAVPPGCDSSSLIHTILTILEERGMDQQFIVEPPVKEETTFTITQVLGGTFALVTLIGSVLATWVSLNTQIATQKVSSDLVIEQLRKDISNLEVTQKENTLKLSSLETSLQTVAKESLNTDTDKELRVKMDILDNSVQSAIKALTLKVNDLDASINQFYNHPSK